MSLWTTKSTHGIVVWRSSCKPGEQEREHDAGDRHVENGCGARTVDERGAA